jgi:hypothetical protein
MHIYISDVRIKSSIRIVVCVLRARQTYYKISKKGSTFLIGKQDLLDDVLIWSESPTNTGLASFAFVPYYDSDSVDKQFAENLWNFDLVEDFMKKMKEKNPMLRSMYLRFE